VGGQRAGVTLRSPLRKNVGIELQKSDSTREKNEKGNQEEEGRIYRRILEYWEQGGGGGGGGDRGGGFSWGREEEEPKKRVGHQLMQTHPKNQNSSEKKVY